ncbi:lysophospholipid acyltransferase family protein [Streptacidiphilus melanogenes]|uniref:lysophospholipid acyltransferase family protein n=1 Tax=Streptacidiphilus melanogenes TaxID=411235 RepID=UPI0005AB47A3|nr:lysophospholipid acyltransferase family protein [Streptacidiphilus melanogenes]
MPGSSTRAARRRYGFWYRLAAVIAKPPLFALTKRDWSGYENIPAEGGFLTAINHNSYLDPLVYGHFQYDSGRPARFLAKAGVFKLPVIKQILHGARMIPVYRGSTDATQAFRAAIDAVDSGECVAFYIEGTLTRDPELWPMTGKTGAARVALTTGAPVIPVAQWGAHEIMPRYAKGGKGNRRFKPFPRKTVRVVAGPPVDLDRWRGQEITSTVLREATDAIMDDITALLEQLRGEKAPAERFDMAKSRAATRGGADGTDGGTDGHKENEKEPAE